MTYLVRDSQPRSRGVVQCSVGRDGRDLGTHERSFHFHVSMGLCGLLGVDVIFRLKWRMPGVRKNSIRGKKGKESGKLGLDTRSCKK